MIRATDPNGHTMRAALTDTALLDPLQVYTGRQAKARGRFQRVVVSVHTNHPGTLVLTDLFYPGWKAFSGARELPIHRANYLFRAVPLRPGEHEIRFEYRPNSVRYGAAVSGATLLAILGATAWTIRQSRAVS